jgi:hypothetical protein
MPPYAPTPRRCRAVPSSAVWEATAGMRGMSFRSLVKMVIYTPETRCLSALYLLHLSCCNAPSHHPPPPPSTPSQPCSAHPPAAAPLRPATTKVLHFPPHALLFKPCTPVTSSYFRLPFSIFTLISPSSPRQSWPAAAASRARPTARKAPPAPRYSPCQWAHPAPTSPLASSLVPKRASWARSAQEAYALRTRQRAS